MLESVGAVFGLCTFATTVGLWIYSCYMDRNYLTSAYKLLLQMQTRTSTAGGPHGWSTAHTPSNNFLAKLQQDRIFPSISEFEKHMSRNPSKKKDHVKFDLEGNELV